MDFPITRPISEKYYSVSSHKKQIRSEFEDGTVSSRASHARARRKYSIGWEALPKNEFLKLLEFFETTVGGTFTITDPLTLSLKTVRFTADSMPKAKTSGYISTIVDVLGVPTSVTEMAFDTGQIEVEEI